MANGLDLAALCLNDAPSATPPDQLSFVTIQTVNRSLLMVAQGVDRP